MDPVTIATGAVAALMPFLAKAGDGVVEELGKQALVKGEAILQTLWSRWRGKPEAEARLAKVVANPGRGRDELVAALAVELTSDPVFANALKDLLDDGSPEIVVRQAIGKDSEATGADIREMQSGRALIEQILQEGARATGFKADLVGRR
jgi:hypothetical protein